jgi:hypothetical protein
MGEWIPNKSRSEGGICIPAILRLEDRMARIDAYLWKCSCHFLEGMLETIFKIEKTALLGPPHFA